MNINLMHILYTVVMLILAFFTAIVITKTLSKYFKLDEKMKNNQETNQNN